MGHGLGQPPLVPGRIAERLEAFASGLPALFSQKSHEESDQREPVDGDVVYRVVIGKVACVVVPGVLKCVNKGGAACQEEYADVTAKFLF